MSNEPLKIQDMRKSMLQVGFYTVEDIEEICRLETEYLEECEKIAEQCETEGYPGNGTNYELRCENARQYYDEQIAYIDEKYA